MKRSIFNNYLLSASYQVVNLIIPVITVPYTARVFGAAGIGEYSIINTVASYFVLFAALGTVTYGSREISYNQKDSYSRSVVFFEIELLTLFTTGIVLCLYVLFVLLFCSNLLLYLICGFQIINVAFDITWLFSGMEDFRITVTRSFAIRCICLIGIFLFVKTKDDLWIYALFTSGVPSVANAFLWIKIKRYVIFPSGVKLNPLRHLKGSFLLFVPTIAVSVYLYADKIMLGLLSDTTIENGYYEESVRIVKMIQVVITSLGPVVMPRIGSIFNQNKEEEIKQIMYKSFNAIWLLAIPLCFGLIGIARIFVPVFFGPGYDRVVPLLYILSFIIIIVGQSNIIANQYLIPTKRQNVFTRIVMCGMATNMMLNAFLIPKYYAIGAAVATILSELLVLVLELITIKNFINLRTVFKMPGKYFLSGLTMLCVLLVEGSHLEPSLITLVIMIATGSTLYFVLLFCFRDSFFQNIIKSKMIKKGRIK